MTDQTALPIEQDAGIRRQMPDQLRRFLLPMPGRKLYLPAAYRIAWFRDEHPDWTILTEVIEGGQAAGIGMVRATIMDAEGRIIATGTKTETKADFPAGWIEKAETGAIARALSFAGYGTAFSLDAADDGTRPADSPLGAPTRPGEPPAASASPSINPGPEQCKSCHAPAGKPHAKTCKL